MTRAPRAPEAPAEATAAAVADTILGGKVHLWQPARGYRVNVDSLLLSHFAAARRTAARRVVDLGSGVGALALAYRHWGSVRRMDLVEVDPSLVELAKRNLAANGASGAVHLANLQDGLPEDLEGVGDLILCNPPYFSAGTRSATGCSGTRHGGVHPFLRAALRAMGPRARAMFAYPAHALPELLDTARHSDLVPKHLQFVHPFMDEPARIALVELRRAKPGGLVVLGPIIEWEKKGARTHLLSRIVSGSVPGE